MRITWKLHFPQVSLGVWLTQCNCMYCSASVRPLGAISYIGFSNKCLILPAIFSSLHQIIFGFTCSLCSWREPINSCFNKSANIKYKPRYCLTLHHIILHPVIALIKEILRLGPLGEGHVSLYHNVYSGTVKEWRRVQEYFSFYKRWKGQCNKNQHVGQTPT